MKELHFIRSADTSKGDGQKILHQFFSKRLVALTYQLYHASGEDFSALAEKIAEMGVPQEDVEMAIYQLKQMIYRVPKVFFNAILTDNPSVKIDFEEASEVDQLIHLAALDILEIDYQGAQLLLKNALKLDNRAVLAYANRAVIELKKYNKKRALNFLNQALAIDPNNVQVLVKKMDLLTKYQPAKLSDFTATVDAVLKNQPQQPMALNYKFQLAWHNDDIPEALKYAKLYFKDNFFEYLSGWPLDGILMNMPEKEALQELDKFEAELSGIAVKQKLARVKEEFIKTKAFMSNLPGGTPIIFL